MKFKVEFIVDDSGDSITKTHEIQEILDDVIDNETSFYTSNWKVERIEED